MLALPRGNNEKAFCSETHLKSDSSVQKKGVQLIAKAGPLQRKFWLTGDHNVSYGELSKLIPWIRNIQYNFYVHPELKEVIYTVRGVWVHKIEFEKFLLRLKVLYNCSRGLPLPQMHSPISSTMSDFCWLKLTYTNNNGLFSWLASWKLFNIIVIVSSGKYDEKNTIK